MNVAGATLIPDAGDDMLPVAGGVEPAGPIDPCDNPGDAVGAGPACTAGGGDPAGDPPIGAIATGPDAAEAVPPPLAVDCETG
jgi:hypothetical protein